MRGSGTGAALLVLLASVLWVTVRSQQRGEVCGGNTGDPPTGERERAGAGGTKRGTRGCGWAHASWRSADLLRAPRGCRDASGSRPPEDAGCSLELSALVSSDSRGHLLSSLAGP